MISFLEFCRDWYCILVFHISAIISKINSCSFFKKKYSMVHNPNIYSRRQYDHDDAFIRMYLACCNPKLAVTAECDVDT